MNKLNTLYILINSLSKAEKRFFKLYSGLHQGDKVYVFLYELLEKNTPAQEVYSLFVEKYKNESFEMAVKHLYRVILSCLVHLRDKEDVQDEIFKHISKAAILFERELYDEAFLELDSAKKLAIKFDNDPLLLLIRRTDLKYRSSLCFENMSEKQLVNKQMKINEVTKYSRSINLHLQLYDILKHRIIHQGYARSEKQKDNLNDLVLSELSLIANNSYKSFEAEKLHLHFQALYYLNSGNYKASIRYYRELIDLFDENKDLIQNPPIYYLSAITGILDTLKATHLYDGMSFFTAKLEELEQGQYATEFIFSVKTLIFQYNLSYYINTGNFDDALKYMDSDGKSLLTKASLLGLDAQLKLYMSCTVLYLYLGNLSEARGIMKKILGSGKVFYSLPSFKTARLINLILQAELGNYELIQNEINSIKRAIHSEKQVFTTEKIVFRFTLAYPLPVYEKTRMQLWSQFKKAFAAIENDKYEQNLLQTFDFLSFIESKLTRIPLKEVLKVKAERK